MRLLTKIQSRKFIALIVACTMFYLYPHYFTGDNLVVVICVFIGGDIGEKILDMMKGRAAK